MRKPTSLVLTTLATIPLLALTAMGPETADEVRRKRAQRMLDENARAQEREAESREYGELPDIDPALIAQYTDTLAIIADPSMEGRAPGSQGIENAAQHIESHLSDLGLTPAFPQTETAADGETEVITKHTTYRQPMQMGAHITVASSALTVGDTAFTETEDYNPLAYSGSGDITAPVSFVGYAVVSGPDNYLGFETNQSIEDRIALVLNYEPMDEDGNSRWDDDGWSHNARLTYKVTALQRRGAAGVIIVTPPGANDPDADTLENIRSTAAPATRMGERSGPEYDIPIVHATPRVAQTILEYVGSDQSLADLTARANESGIVEPLGDKPITLATQMDRAPRWTSNIGAILPGQGDLKDEIVVIGAHYDHVGYGKFGTRFPDRAGEVHPGADDNGTGTVSTMIAAQTLKQRYELLAEDQDARSILFLWFTAEESGLNGSRFYVDNPIAPIEDHALMLNMDMIGTASDGLLEVGGLDTADGFIELVQPHLADAAIPYSEDVSVGRGRSDHASFDNAGVPALFFFTGLHDRYHAPEDTIEHIDEEGAVRVALLVSSIAYDAATRDTRVIHEDANKAKPAKDGPNVRVGIIPSNAAGGGMLIQRVFDDTSASEAGLQPNDIITKWDGQEIDSVESWMPILTTHEPGDTVTLEVTRGDQTLELEMTLRPIE